MKHFLIFILLFMLLAHNGGLNKMNLTISTVPENHPKITSAPSARPPRDDGKILSETGLSSFKKNSSADNSSLSKNISKNATKNSTISTKKLSRQRISPKNSDKKKHHLKKSKVNNSLSCGNKKGLNPRNIYEVPLHFMEPSEGHPDADTNGSKETRPKRSASYEDFGFFKENFSSEPESEAYESYISFEDENVDDKLSLEKEKSKTSWEIKRNAATETNLGDFVERNVSAKILPTFEMEDYLSHIDSFEQPDAFTDAVVQNYDTEMGDKIYKRDVKEMDENHSKKRTKKNTSWGYKIPSDFKENIAKLLIIMLKDKDLINTDLLPSIHTIEKNYLPNEKHDSNQDFYFKESNQNEGHDPDYRHVSTKHHRDSKSPKPKPDRMKSDCGNINKRNDIHPSQPFSVPSLRGLDYDQIGPENPPNRRYAKQSEETLDQNLLVPAYIIKKQPNWFPDGANSKGHDSNYEHTRKFPQSHIQNNPNDNKMKQTKAWTGYDYEADARDHGTVQKNSWKPPQHSESHVKQNPDSSAGSEMTKAFPDAPASLEDYKNSRDLPNHIGRPNNGPIRIPPRVNYAGRTPEYKRSYGLVKDDPRKYLPLADHSIRPPGNPASTQLMERHPPKYYLRDYPTKKPADYETREDVSPKTPSKADFMRDNPKNPTDYHKIRDVSRESFPKPDFVQNVPIICEIQKDISQKSLSKVDSTQDAPKTPTDHEMRKDDSQKSLPVTDFMPDAPKNLADYERMKDTSRKTLSEADFISYAPKNRMDYQMMRDVSQKSLSGADFMQDIPTNLVDYQMMRDISQNSLSNIPDYPKNLVDYEVRKDVRPREDYTNDARKKLVDYEMGKDAPRADYWDETHPVDYEMNDVLLRGPPRTDYAYNSRRNPMDYEIDFPMKTLSGENYVDDVSRNPEYHEILQKGLSGSARRPLAKMRVRENSRKILPKAERDMSRKAFPRDFEWVSPMNYQINRFVPRRRVYVQNSPTDYEVRERKFPGKTIPRTDYQRTDDYDEEKPWKTFSRMDYVDSEEVDRGNFHLRRNYMDALPMNAEDYEMRDDIARKRRRRADYAQRIPTNYTQHPRGADNGDYYKTDDYGMIDEMSLPWRDLRYPSGNRGDDEVQDPQKLLLQRNYRDNPINLGDHQKGKDFSSGLNPDDGMMIFPEENSWKVQSEVSPKTHEQPVIKEPTKGDPHGNYVQNIPVNSSLNKMLQETLLKIFPASAGNNPDAFNFQEIYKLNKIVTKLAEDELEKLENKMTKSNLSISEIPQIHYFKKMSFVHNIYSHPSEEKNRTEGNRRSTGMNDSRLEQPKIKDRKDSMKKLDGYKLADLGRKWQIPSRQKLNYAHRQFDGLNDKDLARKQGSTYSKLGFAPKQSQKKPGNSHKLAKPIFFYQKPFRNGKDLIKNEKPGFSEGHYDSNLIWTVSKNLARNQDTKKFFLLPKRYDPIGSGNEKNTFEKNQKIISLRKLYVKKLLDRLSASFAGNQKIPRKYSDNLGRNSGSLQNFFHELYLLKNLPVAKNPIKIQQKPILAAYRKPGCKSSKKLAFGKNTEVPKNNDRKKLPKNQQEKFGSRQQFHYLRIINRTNPNLIKNQKSDCTHKNHSIPHLKTQPQKGGLEETETDEKSFLDTFRKEKKFFQVIPLHLEGYGDDRNVIIHFLPSAKPNDKSYPPKATEDIHQNLGQFGGTSKSWKNSNRIGTRPEPSVYYLNVLNILDVGKNNLKPVSVRQSSNFFKPALSRVDFKKFSPKNIPAEPSEYLKRMTRKKSITASHQSELKDLVRPNFLETRNDLVRKLAERNFNDPKKYKLVRPAGKGLTNQVFWDRPVYYFGVDEKENLDLKFFSGNGNKLENFRMSPIGNAMGLHLNVSKKVADGKTKMRIPLCRMVDILFSTWMNLVEDRRKPSMKLDDERGSKRNLPGSKIKSIQKFNPGKIIKKLADEGTQLLEIKKEDPKGKNRISLSHKTKQNPSKNLRNFEFFEKEYNIKKLADEIWKDFWSDKKLPGQKSFRKNLMSNSVPQFFGGFKENLKNLMEKFLKQNGNDKTYPHKRQFLSKEKDFEPEKLVSPMSNTEMPKMWKESFKNQIRPDQNRQLETKRRGKNSMGKNRIQSNKKRLIRKSVRDGNLSPGGDQKVFDRNVTKPKTEMFIKSNLFHIFNTSKNLDENQPLILTIEIDALDKNDKKNLSKSDLTIEIPISSELDFTNNTNSMSLDVNYENPPNDVSFPLVIQVENPSDSFRARKEGFKNNPFQNLNKFDDNSDALKIVWKPEEITEGFGRIDPVPSQKKEKNKPKGRTRRAEIKRFHTLKTPVHDQKNEVKNLAKAKFKKRTEFKRDNPVHIPHNLERSNIVQNLDNPKNWLKKLKKKSHLDDTKNDSMRIPEFGRSDSVLDSLINGLNILKDVIGKGGLQGNGLVHSVHSSNDAKNGLGTSRKKVRSVEFGNLESPISELRKLEEEMGTAASGGDPVHFAPSFDVVRNGINKLIKTMRTAEFGRGNQVLNGLKSGLSQLEEMIGKGEIGRNRLVHFAHSLDDAKNDLNTLKKQLRNAEFAKPINGLKNKMDEAETGQVYFDSPKNDLIKLVDMITKPEFGRSSFGPVARGTKNEMRQTKKKIGSGLGRNEPIFFGNLNMNLNKLGETMKKAKFRRNDLLHNLDDLKNDLSPSVGRIEFGSNDPIRFTHSSDDANVLSTLKKKIGDVIHGVENSNSPKNGTKTKKAGKEGVRKNSQISLGGRLESDLINLFETMWKAEFERNDLDHRSKTGGADPVQNPENPKIKTKKIKKQVRKVETGRKEQIDFDGPKNDLIKLKEMMDKAEFDGNDFDRDLDGTENDLNTLEKQLGSAESVQDSESPKIELRKTKKGKGEAETGIYFDSPKSDLIKLTEMMKKTKFGGNDLDDPKNGLSAESDNPVRTDPNSKASKNETIYLDGPRGDLIKLVKMVGDAKVGGKILVLFLHSLVDAKNSLSPSKKKLGNRTFGDLENLEKITGKAESGGDDPAYNAKKTKCKFGKKSAASKKKTKTVEPNLNADVERKKPPKKFSGSDGSGESAESAGNRIRCVEIDLDEKMKHVVCVSRNIRNSNLNHRFSTLDLSDVDIEPNGKQSKAKTRNRENSGRTYSLNDFLGITEDKSLPKLLRRSRMIHYDDGTPVTRYPFRTFSLPVNNMEDSKSENEYEAKKPQLMTDMLVWSNLENSSSEQKDYQLENVIRKEPFIRIIETLNHNLANLNSKEQDHYLADLIDAMEFNDVIKARPVPPSYNLEHSNSEHLDPSFALKKYVQQAIPFYNNDMNVEDDENFKILVKNLLNKPTKLFTPDYNLENTNTEVQYIVNEQRKFSQEHIKQQIYSSHNYPYQYRQVEDEHAKTYQSRPSMPFENHHDFAIRNKLKSFRNEKAFRVAHPFYRPNYLVLNQKEFKRPNAYKSPNEIKNPIGFTKPTGYKYPNDYKRPNYFRNRNFKNPYKNPTDFQKPYGSKNTNGFKNRINVQTKKNSTKNANKLKNSKHSNHFKNVIHMSVRKPIKNQNQAKVQNLSKSKNQAKIWNLSNRNQTNGRNPIKSRPRTENRNEIKKPKEINLPNEIPKELTSRSTNRYEMNIRNDQKDIARMYMYHDDNNGYVDPFRSVTKRDKEGKTEQTQYKDLFKYFQGRTKTTQIPVSPQTKSSAQKKIDKIIKSVNDIILKEVFKNRQRELLNRIPRNKMDSSDSEKHYLMNFENQIGNPSKLDQDIDLDEIEQKYLHDKNFRENLMKLNSYNVPAEYDSLSRRYEDAFRENLTKDSAFLIDDLKEFISQNYYIDTEGTTTKTYPDSAQFDKKDKIEKNDYFAKLAIILKDKDLADAIQLLSDIIFEKLLNKTKKLVQQNPHTSLDFETDYENKIYSDYDILGKFQQNYNRVRRDSESGTGPSREKIDDELATLGNTTRKNTMLTTAWPLAERPLNPPGKKPKRPKRISLVDQKSSIKFDPNPIQKLKKILDLWIYFLKISSRLQNIKKLTKTSKHNRKNTVDKKLHKTLQALHQFYDVIMNDYKNRTDDMPLNSTGTAQNLDVFKELPKIFETNEPKIWPEPTTENWQNATSIDQRFQISNDSASTSKYADDLFDRAWRGAERKQSTEPMEKPTKMWDPSQKTDDGWQKSELHKPNATTIDQVFEKWKKAVPTFKYGKEYEKKIWHEFDREKSTEPMKQQNKFPDAMLSYKTHKSWQRSKTKNANETLANSAPASKYGPEYQNKIWQEFIRKTRIETRGQPTKTRTVNSPESEKFQPKTERHKPIDTIQQIWNEISFKNDIWLKNAIESVDRQKWNDKKQTSTRSGNNKLWQESEGRKLIRSAALSSENLMEYPRIRHESWQVSKPDENKAGQEFWNGVESSKNGDGYEPKSSGESQRMREEEQELETLNEATGDDEDYRPKTWQESKRVEPIETRQKPREWHEGSPSSGNDRAYESREELEFENPIGTKNRKRLKNAQPGFWPQSGNINPSKTDITEESRMWIEGDPQNDDRHESNIWPKMSRTEHEPQNVEESRTWKESGNKLKNPSELDDDSTVMNETGIYHKTWQKLRKILTHGKMEISRSWVPIGREVKTWQNPQNPNKNFTTRISLNIWTEICDEYKPKILNDSDFRKHEKSNKTDHKYENNNQSFYLKNYRVLKKGGVNKTYDSEIWLGRNKNGMNETYDTKFSFDLKKNRLNRSDESNDKKGLDQNVRSHSQKPDRKFKPKPASMNSIETDSKMWQKTLQTNPAELANGKNYQRKRNRQRLDFRKNYGIDRKNNLENRHRVEIMSRPDFNPETWRRLRNDYDSENWEGLRKNKIDPENPEFKRQSIKIKNGQKYYPGFETDRMNPNKSWKRTESRVDSKKNGRSYSSNISIRSKNRKNERSKIFRQKSTKNENPQTKSKNERSDASMASKIPLGPTIGRNQKYDLKTVGSNGSGYDPKFLIKPKNRRNFDFIITMGLRDGRDKILMRSINGGSSKTKRNEREKTGDEPKNWRRLYKTLQKYAKLLSLPNEADGRQQFDDSKISEKNTLFGLGTGETDGVSESRSGQKDKFKTWNQINLLYYPLVFLGSRRRNDFKNRPELNNDRIGLVYYPEVVSRPKNDLKGQNWLNHDGSSKSKPEFRRDGNDLISGSEAGNVPQGQIWSDESRQESKNDGIDFPETFLKSGDDLKSQYGGYKNRQELENDGVDTIDHPKVLLKSEDGLNGQSWLNRDGRPKNSPVYYPEEGLSVGNGWEDENEFDGIDVVHYPQDLKARNGLGWNGLEGSRRQRVFYKLNDPNGVLKARQGVERNEAVESDRRRVFTGREDLNGNSGVSRGLKKNGMFWVHNPRAKPNFKGYKPNGFGVSEKKGVDASFSKRDDREEGKDVGENFRFKKKLKDVDFLKILMSKIERGVVGDLYKMYQNLFKITKLCNCTIWSDAVAANGTKLVGKPKNLFEALMKNDLFEDRTGERNVKGILGKLMEIERNNSIFGRHSLAKRSLVYHYRDPMPDRKFENVKCSLRQNEHILSARTIENSSVKDEPTLLFNLTAIVVRYSDNPQLLKNKKNVTLYEFVDEIIEILQQIKNFNKTKSNGELPKNTTDPDFFDRELPGANNYNKNPKEDSEENTDMCKVFRDLLIYLRIKLQRQMENHVRAFHPKFLEEPIQFQSEEDDEGTKPVSILEKDATDEDSQESVMSLYQPKSLNYISDNIFKNKRALLHASHALSKIKSAMTAPKKTDEICRFKAKPIHYNFIRDFPIKVDYLEERKLKTIHANNRFAVLYHKQITWPDKISKIYAKKYSVQYNSDVIFLNSSTSVISMSNLYDLENRERLFDCLGMHVNHLNFVEQLFNIFRDRNSLFVFMNAKPQDDIFAIFARIVGESPNVKVIITSTSNKWDPYTFNVISIPRYTNGQWLNIRDQKREFKSSVRLIQP